MAVSRRVFLGSTSGAALAAFLTAGGPLGRLPSAVAKPAGPVGPTDTAGDLAAVRSTLSGIYLAHDWLDDGTTARVEWTYQSQAPAYLAALRADGSWADVDYAATNSAANGAAWSPYRALDRMQAMAAAYANPAGPRHLDAALLAGVEKALGYWFQAGPTSVNWWETGIGIQLRLGRIGVLLYGHLAADRMSGIVGTLQSSSSGTGENAVWYAQNVVFRGLLTPDPALVTAGRDAMATAILLSTGDGIQSDLSYHQHGEQLYSAGYGRTMLTDVAQWLYVLRPTSFAFSPISVHDYTGWVLDGTRWMINGDHAEFNVFLNPAPRYASNAERVLESLELLDSAVPDQAARFDQLGKNIRLQSPDTGLTGHKYFWRSDFAAHKRPGWGVTVKMVSARTIGSEWRSSNAKNLNYLYWVPFGTTFIARRGDEYRNIFPVWDWSRLPGATNPAVVVPLNASDPYKQSTTFVGGVDNGLYGAAALDMNKYGTTARKGYFCFDDEFVALGAGITSTDPHPVVTTLNQTRRVGPVVAAGTTVAPGNTLTRTGNWAYHDGTGYAFFEPVAMTVKNATVTGSWADIATGQDPTPVTEDVFGIWLDHGTAPSGATYAYVVRPGVDQGQATAYAQHLPVRVLANSPSLQGVRHDGLGIAQLLFYAAGTAAVRDGVTLAVDRPCMVILDESGAGAPVVTVSAPQAPGVTVNVVLTVRGTVTRGAVTLPDGDRQGVSLTLGAPADDVALRRPVLTSSDHDTSVGAHFLTDGNPNTRWSSAYTDSQWAMVDLLTPQLIDGVTLRWETAYATAYTVETSADGQTWRTVHTTTTGTGGTQKLTFATHPARFVRLALTKRRTAWGYSLWGLEVHAATDLAQGKPTTASSTHAAELAPGNATDGLATTRWGSDYSDPQWLQVDLGAPTAIGTVQLHWETASARAYKLQLSNDATHWTDLHTTTTGPGGVETLPVTGTGRYLRMYGTQRNTPYGYSLFAFEVYGA
ncbi:chondroitin AC lyase [Actinacidiphila alni]|uniref:Chondroitin AC lyase n=1 Tax=Actinacidiphila alni TaxID=380248 RepID=A0A1I2DNC5_9ACTN|nr:polysaccharide lyase family 8 super-sandwich domain-containing protein [Actinacidiphila alni]SFE81783.1 chondroitin AC lyase [Actinacidiphila alni]